MNTIVSFIVISYNEYKFIHEAINSILNLNLSYNYEIIIGDDGSNDGSIDIIKDLKNKYTDKIKYFVMDRDPNLNAKDVIGMIRCSHVIMEGLKKSTGEYFMILSADDYYVNKNFINEAVEYMDNNEKYVALAFGADKLANRKSGTFFDYPKKLYWAKDYLHISNYFIRNVKKLKDSIIDYLCDDNGLVYSLLIIGDIVYNKKKIFEYRKNDDGIMRTADYNENCFMEVIHLQAIMNKGMRFRFSNKRRFWHALRDLYRAKDKLENPKYDKYINFIKYHDNDIFTKYMNSSFVYRLFYIVHAYISLVYFYIWRKLWKII